MIESDRLILRKMTDDDMEDFYDIFSSEEVGKFVHRMSHESVEKYFEKKRNSKPNPFSFAVVLKENNKMIGTCGVKFDESNNCGEISYVFNAKYWNKGYCTEACKVVMKYCFQSAQMNRIEADCLEDNFASQKILKDKLHFNYEGQITNFGFNDAANKAMSFKFYGISREEFLQKCKDF